MKSVIVFGATGQLGAYCVMALHKQGKKVIAVGRRNSDNGFFQTIGVQYIGGVHLEQPETLKDIPQTEIEAVVNMAGTMPAHADADPKTYIQSIIVGTENLCEWMQNTGAKRIVFNTTPSDVAHHFGSLQPVDENAQRDFPRDGGDHAVYTIAKRAATDLLFYYQKSNGFLPCVFRHMTVYGWHPNAYYYSNGTYKILPYRHILRCCINGKPVEVWGEPTRKKELLYIKDFANAVVAGIDSDVCGIFNLPGKRPYTLEEQIDGFIHHFAPSSVEIKKQYRPEMPDTPQNLLKMGRAATEMNWHPKWEWEDACADMRKTLENDPFQLLWGRAEKDDIPQ